MDLCEAIEAFKARKISWRELDPDIITIILNAVEVGTLIPADELPTDDTDELISIAYLKGVADGKDQAAEKAILDLIIDTPQPKGGDDV